MKQKSKRKKRVLVGWAFHNWGCRVYYFDNGQIRIDDEQIFKTRKHFNRYIMEKGHHPKDFPLTKVRITIEEAGR